MEVQPAEVAAPDDLEALLTDWAGAP
jgi:hypothetical protein